MNLRRRGHLNSRIGFRAIQATGGVVSEITVAGVRYRLHSFLRAVHIEMKDIFLTCLAELTWHDQ